MAERGIRIAETAVRFCLGPLEYSHKFIHQGVDKTYVIRQLSSSEKTRPLVIRTMS